MNNTVASHLIRFLIYNFIFALLPLIISWSIRWLSNVEPINGAYAPEILFFGVMISATALGDIADETKVAGENPYFLLLALRGRKAKFRQGRVTRPWLSPSELTACNLSPLGPIECLRTGVDGPFSSPFCKRAKCRAFQMGGRFPQRSLYLMKICLVYINTLMIQQVR